MTHEGDVVLARLSTGRLKTRHFGEFKVAVFHDGNEEAIVLSKGDLGGQRDVICRIHSECISSHVFLSDECDCSEQMFHAQQLISDKRLGLIIYLRQEGRGSGAAAHVSTLDLKRKGMSQHAANRARGFPADARTYGIAAKILGFLQVESVCLLSSNVQKKRELENYGIAVTEVLDLTDEVTVLGPRTRNLADAADDGHADPIRRDKGVHRVLVVGDLNVDYVLPQGAIQGGGIADKGEPLVGGTAFNSACAFKEHGFQAIVFGKVGRDKHADMIKAELRRNRLTSLLGETSDFPTGQCLVFYLDDEGDRFIVQEEQNANDYDLENLKQALRLARLDEGDLVFLVGHEFVRSGPDKVKQLVDLVAARKTPLVLDVVPHNMYKSVPVEEFCAALGDNVHVLIGEFRTFMGFLGRKVAYGDEDAIPENADIERLFRQFPADVLVIRCGIGSISRQLICRRGRRDGVEWLENHPTGYERTPDSDKRGFGDRLTADLIDRFWEDLR
jgi:GTP cyclohydrolase II